MGGHKTTIATVDTGGLDKYQTKHMALFLSRYRIGYNMFN